MTYQSLLYPQQYLSTLEKVSLLAICMYIHNVQTTNYALYHVLGNILPGKRHWDLNADQLKIYSYAVVEKEKKHKA